MVQWGAETASPLRHGLPFSCIYPVGRVAQHRSLSKPGGNNVENPLRETFGLS